MKGREKVFFHLLKLKKLLPSFIQNLPPLEPTPFEKELYQGVLRKWFFLEKQLKFHIERKPSPLLEAVLIFFGYQALFLSESKEYVLFSELQKLSQYLQLHASKQSFLHAILMKLLNNKQKILNSYEELIKKGQLDELGIDFSLIESLAFETPQDCFEGFSVRKKKEILRMRAVEAVRSMLQEPNYWGFTIEDALPVQLRFDEETKRLIHGGKIQVQGLASQRACHFAASVLNEKYLNFCDMTVGKGGKMMSLLASWSALLKKKGMEVPPVRWFCIDRSLFRLNAFQKNVREIIEKNWPQLKVEVVEMDWEEVDQGSLSNLFGGVKFDFMWLDAPCTGFGTLSKLPEIFHLRQENAYAEALKLSHLQKRLCEKAEACLKPSGRLMYSVCTLTKPETTDVLEFVETSLKLKILHKEWIWPQDLFLEGPRVPFGEGFFFATVEKPRS